MRIPVTQSLIVFSSSQHMYFMYCDSFWICGCYKRKEICLHQSPHPTTYTSVWGCACVHVTVCMSIHWLRADTLSKGTKWDIQLCCNGILCVHAWNDCNVYTYSMYVCIVCVDQWKMYRIAFNSIYLTGTSRLCHGHITHYRILRPRAVCVHNKLKKAHCMTSRSASRLS